MNQVIYYGVFIGQDILNLFACILFAHFYFGAMPKSFSKSKRGLILLAFLFLVFSSLCAYLYRLDELPNTVSLLLFLFYHLLSILFPALAFEKSKLRKNIFFALILYKVMISIVAQTFLFAKNINIAANDAKIRTWMNLAYMALNLAWILYAWRASKAPGGKTRYRYSIVSWRAYLLITITLFCVGLLENHICTLEVVSAFDALFSRVISIVTVSALLLLVLHLLRINDSKIISENTMALLSKQMDLLVSYYETLNLYNDEFRRFQHDYKNLILGLTSILEIRDVDQALKYINGLSTDLFTINMTMYDSGNYIADALLRSKNQEASAYNTRIELDGFIPSMRVENWDLCIILTNSIDNAIEACAKIEGEKVIEIHSGIKNNFWLIRVVNPVEKAVEIIGDTVQTSKENNMIHGFGISNIRRAVEKYDGRLTLSCDDNFFVLEAVLKLENKNIVPPS